MLPDRVSNPGPLTYESGALPIALRGPGAKLRIHIERMNRRIKECHLFDTLIPLALAGSINQLWTVACLLALFKGPLVQAWS